MIELEYEKITNRQFITAVRKLIDMKLPVKVAYAVKKVADSLESEGKKIQEAYMVNVVLPYAKQDENKHPILDPKSPLGFEPMEGEFEKAMAAQEAFGKTKVSLDRSKIPVPFLTGDISAGDLAMLDPLLTECVERGNEAVAPVIPIR